MKNHSESPVPFTYCSIETVREELERRRPLIPLVERWWTNHGYGIVQLPPAENPIAQWCRSIATPTFEVKAFTIMARKAGLTPMFSDLYDDTFALDSGSKKACLDKRVMSGFGRNGGPKIRRERLYRGDIRQFMGQRMGDIQTMDGVCLPEYHSQLYAETFGADELRMDLSHWIKQRGLCARGYYAHYLSMFVAHSVLFEDFDGGQSGSKLIRFMNNVVNPAHRELLYTFDVPLLVVRMPWADRFDYYPEPCTDWQSHGIIPDEILEME